MILWDLFDGNSRDFGHEHDDFARIHHAIAVSVQCFYNFPNSIAVCHCCDDKLEGEKFVAVSLCKTGLAIRPCVFKVSLINSVKSMTVLTRVRLANAAKWGL